MERARSLAALTVMNYLEHKADGLRAAAGLVVGRWAVLSVMSSYVSFYVISK
jgi:hypothetical protein